MWRVPSPRSPVQLGVSPSKSRNPAVRPALHPGAHAPPLIQSLFQAFHFVFVYNAPQLGLWCNEQRLDT
jgi:hypothetical protein